MNYSLIKSVSTLNSSRSIGIRGLIKYFSDRKVESAEPREETLVKRQLPENYDPKNVTKDDLKWREDWNEETKNYFKMLRTFHSESNNVEISKLLQSDIDFSPSAIFRWFKRRQEKKEIILQSYIPERNQILGNELAAAHFVVFRGGAVKFHQEDKWIKADKYNEYALPDRYVGGKYLEAIDCSGMTLYYEGLENFKNLQNLNWLSVNGCENIDDWCIDAIAGTLYENLVYLDLRNCPNVTEKGIVALWKMENLRILYLDDVLRSSEYEMTVLLLQEYLPHLEIKVGEYDD